MSKSTYLLKLPTSVRTAGQEWRNRGRIAESVHRVGCRQKVGAIETAREFLERRGPC